MIRIFYELSKSLRLLEDMPIGVYDSNVSNSVDIQLEILRLFPCDREGYLAIEINRTIRYINLRELRQLINELEYKQYEKMKKGFR